MLACKSTYKALLLVTVLLSAVTLYADERPYLCEFGFQGGTSYYVGDATRHIFNYPRWSAGAQFRYKFTERWALQVKGQMQEIMFPAPDANGYPIQKPAATDLLKNQLVCIDAVGEFNFFRLGQKQYNSKVKQITPYIFLGIGVGLYNDFKSAGAYLPFGFGMKWKFAPRWGLNLAWQHQLFFADNLENTAAYDNTYNLNGSNILNLDLTSTLTLGIVFEFARQRSVCKKCQ